MPRPTPPSGPRATLLRVAWLAIALGLLLQLAMLLLAPGFGKDSSPDRSWPRRSRRCRGRCWSVSASPRPGGHQGPPAAGGLTGLLAAPALLARGVNDCCSRRLRPGRLHRRDPQNPLDPPAAADRPLTASLAAAAEQTPLHPRFPLVAAPARSPSRWGRGVSWNGATGPGSATAALSTPAGTWTATPTLANTAWSGCAGPTAPNSQATQASATPAATDRHQNARRCRWRRSASGAIAGRHSRQPGTRAGRRSRGSLRGRPSRRDYPA
jgi:hypothetical protein